MSMIDTIRVKSTLGIPLNREEVISLIQVFDASNDLHAMLKRYVTPEPLESFITISVDDEIVSDFTKKLNELQRTLRVLS